MTDIHCRTVTPMSEMIEVYVEIEKLKQSVDILREQIVHDDQTVHCELFDARHHAKKIIEKLRHVQSILSLYEEGKRQRQAKEPPNPPTPFRPKLVS